MKIVFTEREVSEILVAHIRRTTGYMMDEVLINPYREDFAVVTQSEKLKEELAKPQLDDPFEDL